MFPNTVDYSFIAYEVAQTHWSPNRTVRRVLIGLAAGIRVLITLPQEWWLHVAQLDVTDELKTTVFGMGLDYTCGTAFTNRLGVSGLAVRSVPTA